MASNKAEQFRSQQSLMTGILQKGFILAVLYFLFLVIAPVSSNAQLSIQLGGDDGQYRAYLNQNGYDRIETVKISITHSRYRACKGNKRYDIDFKWTGEIDVNVIGNCRALVTKETIAQTLRREGYERISLEERAGKFLAIACRAGQRSRVEFNTVGDIIRERPLGQCRQELSPTDIQAKLENEGFDQIIFTDRRLPRYQLMACRGNEKVHLTVNRTGDVVDLQPAGQCREFVRPDQLTRIVEEKGLTRVEITDAELPGYVAIACRNDRKVRVTLDRFGDIINEVRIGDCRQSFTEAEIEEYMLEQGYTNVTVSAGPRNTYVATGCIQGRLTEVTLTRFGRFVDRKDRGGCNSPRINELADILRNRGYTDLNFYIDACRRGTKERIFIDEYANRIDTRRLGGC